MKTSPLRSIQAPQHAVVYTARVLSVTDNFCEIDLDGVRYQAAIVFSCLVRPVEHDLVLCVLSTDGDYYVTAIAQREASAAMTLSFPADVTMQAPAGSINLQSTESVTIAAADQFNCVADQALHKSRAAVINYQNLTASGEQVQASYSSVKLFSDFITTLSRQVLQKFKSYIRHSEDNDQVRSGNMTRQVKGLYTMDSEHSIMVSKKDTKIDAERIHLG